MAQNIYGFEKKKSSKAINILEIIIIAVFVIAIIAMIIFYAMFSKGGSHPKFFGYNIYLTRTTSMEPAIPENTAVFAKADEINTLSAGDVVLCNLQTDNVISTVILRIQEIQIENGKTFYILKADTNADNILLKVSQENIIAKAVSSSIGFGKLLAFATSKFGIITVCIIPSILMIIIQVLRIMRLKRLEEEDDDDEYDNDDVLFSTLERDEPEFTKPQAPVAPPVKKLYVGDEGKAEYIKKAVPNSDYSELHETILNTQPHPMRTPTAASTKLSEQRSTVSSNFKQKPVNREYESGNNRNFEKPSNNFYDTQQDTTFDRPKFYYEKPEPVERRLDPPVVENPVGITIPPDAVKPKETIAPPPKQQSNKTVEELMKVIDQAQSGLKK